MNKTVAFQDWFERTAGCWPWRGNIRHDGYALWGSKMAHRVVYEHLRRPIAPGMSLDHLCGNTWCVNPDHMEEVSYGENTRRAMEMLSWRYMIRRFLDTGRYESSNAAGQRRYHAKKRRPA